jgi:hypothetical protein
MIQSIAEDWRADMGKVRTNLVTMSRQQIHFQQAVSIQWFPPGSTGPSLGIDPHMISRRHQRCITPSRAGNTFDARSVNSFHLTSGESPSKSTPNLHVAGRQEGT